jgi:D-serine deaminase-like pyridoxal phosphate-dependent protein
MPPLHPAYRLPDADQLTTPSLVFYPELIRANIAAVIAAAGGPQRLRPHVKTHKTLEIVKLQLAAGVTKHKCATIAEAEMLAMAGTPDVLIAYPLVGPNPTRLAHLVQRFPGTQFSSIVDHPHHITALSTAMQGLPQPLPVLLDLNMGMNRTGIAPGPEALNLYGQLAQTPGLQPGGFHGYDGHNNAESRADRDAMARTNLTRIQDLQAEAVRRGWPVPRLVCGGTPGFPSYAAMQDVPDLECSPGTYVLHDLGYGSRFPDIVGVTPAAVLLTRVVSRPSANRVTFDLGNKSVAADPPLAKRVYLLDAPEYTIVTHSEEHLVIETNEPDRFTVGDVVYAIPSHVCPSVALHRDALLAENHRIVGRWTITARDRFLTV